MIAVNGHTIPDKKFPDGTRMMLDMSDLLDDKEEIFKIVWKYNNEGELSLLIFLAEYIKETFPKKGMELYLPYVPNARMDRTKNKKEVPTLKYFTRTINRLGFDKVTILDPHSIATPIAIDRVEVLPADEYIRKAWCEVYKLIPSRDACDPDDLGVLNSPKFAFYFPDKGSLKNADIINELRRLTDVKYSANREQALAGSQAYFDVHLFYGEKNRDWETGDITGLTIRNERGDEISKGDLKGFTILMIDDIISYGGTLYYGAKEMKRCGARTIYAYATHTENSALDEQKGKFKISLDTGDIERLYTTDSIYTGDHKSIQVFTI